MSTWVALCQMWKKLQYINDLLMAKKPMTIHSLKDLILQSLKSCMSLLM